MNTWNTFLLLFYLIILVASFILTWVYRKFALRKSLLDIPNQRSSHRVPTPRGGGLAIVLAWLGGLGWLHLHHLIDTELFYALLCSLPLVILGLMDDIFSLKPAVRFAGQALAAAGALYFLGGLKMIGLGFATLTGTWLFTPLAFLGIIWFTNLFNFLDGIDGYAAMEAIFAGLAFFFLTGNHTGLLLAVATLGFLFWNWQPARIFMGDVGSTVLGFTIVVLIIHFQNTEQLPLISSLVLTALFWFDATVTLYRRWKNRETLSQAHKKHAYQRIVQYGFSHQKTVAWGFALNIAAFLMVCPFPAHSRWLLLPLIADILILTWFMRLIDHRQPFPYSQKN